MVIGGMATIPGREDSLMQAVKSVLAPESPVEQLHIAFNGHNYHRVTKFLSDLPSAMSARISWTLATGNNYGDAAKFVAYDGTQPFYSFDDDLTYTPQYWERFKEAREVLLRTGAYPCVLSLHGRSLLPPYRNYYGRNAVKYACLTTVEDFHKVTFPGTGVLYIPPGLLKMRLHQFTHPNMADVWVGKFCKEQGVSCYVIPHKMGDVVHNAIDKNKTIAVSMRSPYVDEIAREVELTGNDE